MSGMPDRIAEGVVQHDRVQIAALEGRVPSETLTASKTLKDTDSGKTYYIATDALTVTLPPTATDKLGVNFTFVNSGADGNNIITLSPNASDALHGVITLAATIVELSGTDDKDLINTKATAGTGDFARIESNGVDWYVTGSSGIWASEA